jgi:hypothetical protein
MLADGLANDLALHFLRHGKSSVSFGPYRKTNPQNPEDHIGDPGRQQMSGCRNHHNYSDQQGHIGPLDAIVGGHDTRPPLHARVSLTIMSPAYVSRFPLLRLARPGLGRASLV